LLGPRGYTFASRFKDWKESVQEDRAKQRGLARRAFTDV
jgi:hypothetical protein